MSNHKILVIEDDPAVRHGLVAALKSSGYETSEADTGPEGLRAALDGGHDLLLLDIVLPGMNGFDILKVLQRERPGVPVIILSAKGSEGDRLRGLETGADDYIVKSTFSARELLARVKAVLRRSPARPLNLGNIPIPGGEVDLGRHVIHFNDSTDQPLTEQEFRLLRYLATHPGRVINRDELLQYAWGMDNALATETRRVDMTIVRLREKIRDKNCTIIQTMRGRGYQFVPPGSPPASE